MNRNDFDISICPSKNSKGVAWGIRFLGKNVSSGFAYNEGAARENAEREISSILRDPFSNARAIEKITRMKHNGLCPYCEREYGWNGQECPYCGYNRIGENMSKKFRGADFQAKKSSTFGANGKNAFQKKKSSAFVSFVEHIDYEDGYEVDAYEVWPYAMDVETSPNGDVSFDIYPKTGDVYLPTIYGPSRIRDSFEIQTTSYGALDEYRFREFIESYETALEVVIALKEEFGF